MKIPRRVDLTTGGVNGRVNIGEVDGPVKVSGINGKVNVGQAVGYTELSGINGSVTITIAQLSQRGIDASGINGRVELRFTEDINADLDVTGINGSVQADMPNVTVFGKISRDNFRAKIGSGGTPIQVSGINGGVRYGSRFRRKLTLFTFRWLVMLGHFTAETQRAQMCFAEGRIVFLCVISVCFASLR